MSLNEIAMKRLKDGRRQQYEAKRRLEKNPNDKLARSDLEWAIYDIKRANSEIAAFKRSRSNDQGKKA